jgi:hypothetical protein
MPKEEEPIWQSEQRDLLHLIHLKQRELKLYRSTKMPLTHEYIEHSNRQIDQLIRRYTLLYVGFMQVWGNVDLVRHILGFVLGGHHEVLTKNCEKPSCLSYLALGDVWKRATCLELIKIRLWDDDWGRKMVKRFGGNTYPNVTDLSVGNVGLFKLLLEHGATFPSLRALHLEEDTGFIIIERKTVKTLEQYEAEVQEAFAAGAKSYGCPHPYDDKDKIFYQSSVNLRATWTFWKNYFKTPGTQSTLTIHILDSHLNRSRLENKGFEVSARKPPERYFEDRWVKTILTRENVEANLEKKRKRPDNGTKSHKRNKKTDPSL